MSKLVWAASVYYDKIHLIFTWPFVRVSGPRIEKIGKVRYSRHLFTTCLVLYQWSHILSNFYSWYYSFHVPLLFPLLCHFIGECGHDEGGIIVGRELSLMASFSVLNVILFVWTVKCSYSNGKKVSDNFCMDWVRRFTSVSIVTVVQKKTMLVLVRKKKN